jgi:UrcA family protein
MNRPLVFLLSLTVAALTVSAACAAPRDNQSRIVAYDDLDLTTAAGVRALNRRLGQAANEICLDASGPAPAASVGASCRADAWRSGRSQAESAIARLQPTTEPSSTSQETGE